MDTLGRTRLLYLMEHEPQRMLELYQSGQIMEIEHQLAEDMQRAVQYMKERVREGMSELEAEDRAVELILAPSDSEEFHDHPPQPQISPQVKGGDHRPSGSAGGGVRPPGEKAGRQRGKIEN